MILSDLDAVNQIAKQLADIDSSVASAAKVVILVNGKPIDPALLRQLHAVGDPIVVQFFASARATLVAKLNALGVTES